MTRTEIYLVYMIFEFEWRRCGSSIFENDALRVRFLSWLIDGRLVTVAAAACDVKLTRWW